MAGRVQLNPEVKRRRNPRTIIIPKTVTFEWKGPFENWSRSFVRKNFWRVRELFGSEDDALQECALIFVRCCNSYAGKVNNPKWLMALFKRAVANDWNTFSQKDWRRRSIAPEAAPILSSSWETEALEAALAQGSDEAKLVITAILSAPSELLAIIFFDLDPNKLNRRLKRFFGISKSKRDIVGELRGLLS